MCIKFIIFHCVFLISLITSAKEYQIESVPNPKAIDAGYISDPENILSQEAYTEINQLFATLEKNTSNQIALVILESIGTEVPKDFAYKLFNNWGIGIKGKDNGLLMLMVMDQRRIEFETGYGMEAILTDATCKSIQMKYMVPKFKEGDYNAGLLEGCRATSDILRSGENSSYFLTMNATTDEDEVIKNVLTIIFAVVFFLSVLVVYIIKSQKKTFLNLINDRKEIDGTLIVEISRNYWLVLYLIIPVTLILGSYSFFGVKNYFLNFSLVLYCYFLVILIEKWIRSVRFYSSIKSSNDFYFNYTNYVALYVNSWWKVLLFPFPFIFYIILYFLNKSKLRNHPRNCTNCSASLHKLDEVSDDKHLTKSQLLEENLKSIDYDVWHCNSCSANQILSYKSYFSKYSDCSKCSTKAYYLESNVTLVSATYSSSGTGQKTYSCKFCKHVVRNTYTIPMKVKSSSSGSSGGGSSFGGGSSGGGGSGSSW